MDYACWKTRLAHCRGIGGARTASDQPRTSPLGAARPLPPSADIGPGGQSVGQAAQFCLGRLALQVFRTKQLRKTRNRSFGTVLRGGPSAFSAEGHERRPPNLLLRRTAIRDDRIKSIVVRLGDVPYNSCSHPESLNCFANRVCNCRRRRRKVTRSNFPWRCNPKTTIAN
jgi:hypothetical protein